MLSSLFDRLPRLPLVIVIIFLSFIISLSLPGTAPVASAISTNDGLQVTRLDTGAARSRCPLWNPIYVKQDATGNGSGNNWPNAYNDLLAARRWPISASAAAMPLPEAAAWPLSATASPS